MAVVLVPEMEEGAWSDECAAKKLMKVREDSSLESPAWVWISSR